MHRCSTPMSCNLQSPGGSEGHETEPRSAGNTKIFHMKLQHFVQVKRGPAPPPVKLGPLLTHFTLRITHLCDYYLPSSQVRAPEGQSPSIPKSSSMCSACHLVGASHTRSTPTECSSPEAQQHALLSPSPGSLEAAALKRRTRDTDGTPPDFSISHTRRLSG